MIESSADVAQVELTGKTSAADEVNGHQRRRSTEVVFEDDGSSVSAVNTLGPYVEEDALCAGRANW